MTSTTSSCILIPFRKSTHLSFSTAVQQYISQKYNQHPEMFRQDIDAIDALRKNAVNVREAHSSGIKKLHAYAAQLVWIGGKFPIDIGVDFAWYSAIKSDTERPLVQNNLQYELLNILFNLAALYCHLGASTNVHTDVSGIKAAANYYSLAAGVLSHMKTAVLPELRMQTPPEDMDDATLESLMQLMLAQSQECFWQKAVTENYKDATIAKLAARVSDLYNLAAESAIQSESMSSVWIHHISAKHHHFAAAAQYRASLDCLDKQKYGEEIARLRDTVACANEGLRETRAAYLTGRVGHDLMSLKERAQESLKRAERDNDVIYLASVPSKSELKILDRANLAIARVPEQVSSPYAFLGEQADFGPALFNKLVPFAVHLAISIYEERRDRYVNQNIIRELEVLTERAHSFLSSLNLPGSLQALEKPLGLPGSLVQHAEEIRQADAINRIHNSFTDIEKLRANDRAIFEEGKSILASEEEEDLILRRKYGEQLWTRPESQKDHQGGGAKLWAQIATVEGYFASSASLDTTIRDKFAAVEDMLLLLADSNRALMDFLPSSRQTEIPESVKPVLGRLRATYSNCLRLLSRRRKAIDSLRERASADDVKSEVLAKAANFERSYPKTPLAAAHFDNFFESRLDSLYENDLALVQREREEQEDYLAEVARVNGDFEAQKQRASTNRPENKQREAALQRLDAAYCRYTETINNIEVGRKFYNDLSRIVGQFRDKCRTWVAERRRDARSLENVEFFNKDWVVIGAKTSLSSALEKITSIPAGLFSPAWYNLCAGGMARQSLHLLSVAQKLSWASTRQTTRAEDLAYCLMGLFDVHMPLLYGEGESKPFARLQAEIAKQTNDQSLFAWGGWYDQEGCDSTVLCYSLYAPHPSLFAGLGDIRTSYSRLVSILDHWAPPFETPNDGYLRIKMRVCPNDDQGILGFMDDDHIAFLECEIHGTTDTVVGLFVKRLEDVNGVEVH